MLFVTQDPALLQTLRVAPNLDPGPRRAAKHALIEGGVDEPKLPGPRRDGRVFYQQRPGREHQTDSPRLIRLDPGLQEPSYENCMLFALVGSEVLFALPR